MKFGFVAHPTSLELRRHAMSLDLLERISMDLEKPLYRKENWRYRDLIPLMHFGQIRSEKGLTCEGLVMYLPMTAEEMLERPLHANRRLLGGIGALKDLGVELVGLGGFTGILGARGEQTRAKAAIEVTTGNSLTAYAGYQAFLHIEECLGLDPAAARVTVVGYPGSISLVIAELLLKRGYRLNLVHRFERKDAKSLLEYLPQVDASRVFLTADVSSCYAEGRVFISATSSGNVIDPDQLLPGSVVIDIALPRDVIERDRRREDILVIDGGTVNAGEGVHLGLEWSRQSPRNQINGCLAETVILALENERESFSIGRELPEDKVMLVGRWAEENGFRPLPVYSNGERVDPSRLRALRRFHQRDRTGIGLDELDAKTRRAEACGRFRRFINPVQGEFYEFNKLEHVFASASGCTLTEVDGTCYLDFVAGYGCLNMGHNHPAIRQAVQEHLASLEPTFVQYVSVPEKTGRLAERLCELAPGKMERVFFSNSGTEAVEAALKLARAATGKSRIVYTENSYHGKTLGALSVTGREKHRREFYPLVPDCSAVPFGDAAALGQALASADAAAFIVEPIQGEGGVIVPPAGYLSAVQKICRERGVLLIVDEIQTGFGRTGKIFASEWEHVEPDILVVAKSLSGGLVPIGATLSRADLWDDAYGTSSRCSLHTSTFGGNNLAAAAGLAAIDVLLKERLWENADSVGSALKGALADGAREFTFVKEVRGKGLMMGIQFEQSFEGGMTGFARELSARLPGNWQQLYRFLPDRARNHLLDAARSLEQSLKEMFCLRIVTKMAREHQILTYVTANQSNVMRIQPPLVLTLEEARRFSIAFAETCRDMSTAME